MIRVSTHARRTRLRSGSKLASVPVNSRPSSIPIYIIDDDDDDACGCVGVFVAALQTRAQQYSGLASAVRCVVHSHTRSRLPSSSRPLSIFGELFSCTSYKSTSTISTWYCEASNNHNTWRIVTAKLIPSCACVVERECKNDKDIVVRHKEQV
jgi:hypothetical protein